MINTNLSIRNKNFKQCRFTRLNFLDQIVFLSGKEMDFRLPEV